MNRRDIRNDLLRKVWIESIANAPAYILEDVASAINSALQQMWLSPHQYFRTEPSTAVVPSGQTSVALLPGVQEIVGPVSTPSRQLIRMATRGDFQNANGYYATPEEPTYYFLDTTRGNGNDVVEIALKVWPAPATDLTVSFEAVNECPNYSPADLDSASGVPIPHQYVESLFLPLARFEITKSHWFWDKDRLKDIDLAAQAARERLGLANPDTGTQGGTR